MRPVLKKSLIGVRLGSFGEPSTGFRRFTVKVTSMSMDDPLCDGHVQAQISRPSESMVISCSLCFHLDTDTSFPTRTVDRDVAKFVREASRANSPSRLLVTRSKVPTLLRMVCSTHSSRCSEGVKNGSWRLPGKWRREEQSLTCRIKQALQVAAEFFSFDRWQPGTVYKDWEPPEEVCCKVVPWADVV